MKTPNYRELIINAWAAAERDASLRTGALDALITLRDIALADTTGTPKAAEPKLCTHGHPLTHICRKCMEEGPAYKIPAGAMLIEFDGGSANNNPGLPMGYGNGYGSYRIDRGLIKKLTWGPMSANTAEILTMTEGIAIAAGLYKRPILHIVGDSQIALKWANVCAGNRAAKMSKKSSPEFKKAIASLSKTIMEYSVSLTTEWHGRHNSVRIFGH